jgi:hypothetical protein
VQYAYCALQYEHTIDPEEVGPPGVWGLKKKSADPATCALNRARFTDHRPPPFLASYNMSLIAIYLHEKKIYSIILPLASKCRSELFKKVNSTTHKQPA